MPLKCNFKRLHPMTETFWSSYWVSPNKYDIYVQLYTHSSSQKRIVVAVVDMTSYYQKLSETLE